MFAHNLSIESADKKITVKRGDDVIAETERAVILHEPPLTPVFYIPKDDVNSGILVPSDHKSHCPFKGDASYFHLKTGDEIVENAAWSYEAPKEDAAGIMGFIAFYDWAITIDAT